MAEGEPPDYSADILKKFVQSVPRGGNGRELQVTDFGHPLGQKPSGLRRQGNKLEIREDLPNGEVRWHEIEPRWAKWFIDRTTQISWEILG